MHPLNRYRDNKPDFAALARNYASFAPFVLIDEKEQAHISFQDAAALRALTACLLKEDWGYDVELSDDRLCPTIANRLDYLLHVLDLERLLSRHDGGTQKQKRLKVLDIGTGHIAIYPLLLHRLRPIAEIVATELDEVSFHNAVKTRQNNDIPYTDISLLRPGPNHPILFPIFDEIAAARAGSSITGEHADGGSMAVTGGTGNKGNWDIVICNPPFFGSEAEMKEGQEAKIGGVPAAPTAAANELITRGGEVAFVGQMIEESTQLGEACAYYTSLIGKYASLQLLVYQLRRAKIDNYFIKIMRQARTTRWILGWSFGAIRLPDTFIRPDAFMPGTSFARLLPPLNSFSHTPEPPMAIEELRRKVLEVLISVELATENGGHGSPISIAPVAVTWSRAARRQAAREGAPPKEATETTGTPAKSALFRADFLFESAHAENRNTTATGSTGAPQITEEAGGAASGGTVKLVWLEGRDRSMVEALWKFMLTKAQLLGHENK